MNRVGLKDYLLNHADDNDLLDCAKAWDAANEYGQFDTCQFQLRSERRAI